MNTTTARSTGSACAVRVEGWKAHTPVAILLVLLLLAPGCGPGEAEKGESAAGATAPPAAAEPVRGGTLVVAWISDADVLNPVVQQSLLAQHLGTLLFPNLTSEGFADCRLQQVPYLAESWQWSDGGRTLTFRLREGVRWEDGTPVTSADVALTTELMRDESVASPRYNNVERVAAVETPDARTAVFRFTEPYEAQTQLSHASQDLLPRHLLAGADRQTLRGHPFGFRPLAAGPFRLERWTRNQEIVLAANPGYTLGAPPYIERVVFRVIPEYTTRLAELIRGTVDVVDNLQVEDVARLRQENPEIRIIPRGWRFLEYLGWNLRDPLFADRRARRALTMCLDRETVIAALLSGGGERYGRPAVGTITPELCRQHNDAIPPLPFDPRAGQALLAELGWEDRDGDGLLDREGLPFRFTLKTNSGNPRRERVAVLVQGQLRRVGIDVRIESVEGTTLTDQLRRKEFQAVLYGWSASLYVDPTEFWHSGEEYEYNFCSYANPEVDRLIESGVAETDPARAQATWREVQRLIYEDQPYTFLYWVNSLMGVNRRVQGVEANILSPLYGLERWWIEPGRPGR